MRDVFYNLSFQQNAIASVTYPAQWLHIASNSVVKISGSAVTSQLINCVVTVLPVVNNGDYTVTVQSPCSHFTT